MYQVLYRKYRPKVFSDVVGQEHITTTLSKEVETGKHSHAYLFTGSRGTGKTTCAKILAKAVNCPNAVEGNPCNECEICKGIDNGSILDVTEIDAASNNGVANIRDIIDEITFTPASCKYRVYIIDEVHMLSIGAFNALLKTLEEPPSHVKFILATTEVHKLPVTILSRCQRFDFRRVTPEAMCKRMQYIAQCEGFTATDEALSLIARVADGGMRDALSLLDQCAGHEKNITAELVCSVAGMTSRDHLFSLADAFCKNDSAGALDIIGRLHLNSCDMERLCSDLIVHFRNLMVTKTVRNATELVVCTDAELELYKQQSKKFTLEAVLYCISSLQQSLSNIKSGVNRRTEMEMVAIKLSTPSLSDEKDAILSRLSALESKLKGTAVVIEKKATAETAAAPESETPTQAATEEPTPVAEATVQAEGISGQPSEAASEAPTGDEEIDWAEVLSELTKINMPLWGVMNSSSAVVRQDRVLIISDNPTLGEFIRRPGYSRDVKLAIYNVTGKKYRLGLYSGSGAPTTPSVTAKPKDPLQDLMNNARAQGVNVDVTD